MFWLVFVGLKLAEVAALVFFPWGVGHLVNKGTHELETNIGEWATGIGVIVLVICALLLLVLLGTGFYELNVWLTNLIVGGA